eukprot:1529554-Rhodomonas_salina.1
MRHAGGKRCRGMVGAHDADNSFLIHETHPFRCILQLVLDSTDHSSLLQLNTRVHSSTHQQLPLSPCASTHLTLSSRASPHINTSRFPHCAISTPPSTLPPPPSLRCETEHPRRHPLPVLLTQPRAPSLVFALAQRHVWGAKELEEEGAEAESDGLEPLSAWPPLPCPHRQLPHQPPQRRLPPLSPSSFLLLPLVLLPFVLFLLIIILIFLTLLLLIFILFILILIRVSIGVEPAVAGQAGRRDAVGLVGAHTVVEEHAHTQRLCERPVLLPPEALPPRQPPARREEQR